MNVLHVYRTYFPDPPGGLQEAIRQIALSTRAFGVSPTVYTLSPNPDPQVVDRPEARVFRARSWAAPASCDLGGAQAFALFSKLAGEADVVHYHFPWPFADVLHLTVAPHVPCVMTYHSDVVRQRVLGKFYAPVMRQMLRSMDRVVATSPNYAASSAVLALPGIRERVEVIPLGIEESSYPQPTDTGIVQRLGIGADEPFVLFIGVLRYYKGLHTLVEAAAQTSVKIVIAGSGPERERLVQQVSSLGLNNIVFAGQVSDAEKVDLLRRCHTFVLPSHLRSEAFGMVIIEAQMFAKPVISCEIGSGMSYVNAHEESGLVVPPEDTTAMAAAINRLLGDTNLAARLGGGARQRYERLFSGSALGSAYAKLYSDVIGKP